MSECLNVHMSQMSHVNHMRLVSQVSQVFPIGTFLTTFFSCPASILIGYRRIIHLSHLGQVTQVSQVFLIILGTCLATFVFMSWLKSDWL